MIIITLLLGVSLCTFCLIVFLHLSGSAFDIKAASHVEHTGGLYIIKMNTHSYDKDI